MVAIERRRRLLSRNPEQQDSESTDSETSSLRESRNNPARIRLETVGAVAMSIAAVAIAWSAYQSTRWSGIMSINFSQASVERAESVRRTDVAGFQVLADVIIFADWVAAVSEKDFERAASFRARMDGELGEAMNRWLGDWAPGDDIPEGDPFDEGSYVSPIATASSERAQEAEERFSKALKANQTSDNYILATVVFASTLFFAGISSRFESLAVIRMFVVLAIVFLVAGFVFTLFEPVTVSV
jgi:hypothetical protein